MQILRVRENFSRLYHSLNSSNNVEQKWSSILLDKLSDQSEYVLRSQKLSTEVNCFTLKKIGEELHLETSYLIGYDYIDNEIPIMIEPKFSYNKEDYSIDFYNILFNSLTYVKSS